MGGRILSKIYWNEEMKIFAKQWEETKEYGDELRFGNYLFAASWLTKFIWLEYSPIQKLAMFVNFPFIDLKSHQSQICKCESRSHRMLSNSKKKMMWVLLDGHDTKSQHHIVSLFVHWWEPNSFSSLIFLYFYFINHFMYIFYNICFKI